MAVKQDPSPEQIAAACLEIQRGWSAVERMRRLRADLRPTVMCADGRHEAVTADDYSGHHEQHKAYQEAESEG